jgi:hypothetical protein
MRTPQESLPGAMFKADASKAIKIALSKQSFRGTALKKTIWNLLIDF